MTGTLTFSPLAADIEALLSAIYALELDQEAHVRALREAWSRPRLGGEAAMCISHRACRAQVLAVEHFDAGRPELVPIAAQASAAMSREMKLRLLRGKPMGGLVTSAFARTRAMQVSRQLGVPEFVGMMAPTLSGFNVVLGTPLQAHPDEPVRAGIFPELAEHLAAAWRLRKRLAAPDAFAESAEGIFQPDGKLRDAFGPVQSENARERLRQLVLARERILRSPGERLWPALLDGRYTIIDRFERSGARYVVAYRNAATASRLSRLTPLERQVVEAASAGTPFKEVAYELATSQTRVSNILRDALRKLGLPSAIDLTLLASSSDFVTLDDELLGPSIVSAFALRGPSADCLLELTPAERAVTADLLRGHSNREIGARRNRSQRTIANQVASILDKMRVPTRRALVAKLNPPLSEPKEMTKHRA